MWWAGATLRCPRIAWATLPSRFRQLKLAAFIALRIARSKRSTTLSLVTLISIVGIACGVLALTVVLAVTDGFQQAFQDRILGIFPHLVVTRTSSAFRDYEAVLDTIRTTPGVKGATPLTGDEMMVANGPYRAGATVQGIDLPSVASVLDLAALVRTDDLPPGADAATRNPLDGLGEDPGLSVDGATRTLRTPVEGSCLTLIQTGTLAPLVLIDERTSPDADRFRVKALDLRAKTSPVELVPQSGAIITIYETPEPMLLDGGSVGTQATDESAATPARWGREIEVPNGTFSLSATGEKLDLRSERAYSIILWEPAPGRVQSILLTESPDTVIAERTALIRVVDMRPESDTSTLVWNGKDAPLATTHAGEFTGFLPVTARLPGVLLGRTLAKKLQAKLGDALTFVTPLRGLDNKMVGPFGMLPSSARFELAGIFEAGFHDHDSRLALVNIAVAQRFMNRGKLVRSLAVRTDSLVSIDATKARLQRSLDPYPFEDLIQRTYDFESKLATLVGPEYDPKFSPPSTNAPFISGLRNVFQMVNTLRYPGAESATQNRFQIFDWREKNINLFSALELQKIVLTIFFFIIILVGSFVVVGSQTMVVHEKTPDIAILKAMGATSGFVRLVFTLQGLFVAVIGLIAGLAIGLGLIAIIQAVDYQLDSSIYLIDHLPATVDVSELALVALGTLLCTLLTTQISAGRAAAKTPVAGLRQID